MVILPYEAAGVNAHKAEWVVFKECLEIYIRLTNVTERKMHKIILSKFKENPNLHDVLRKV